MLNSEFLIICYNLYFFISNYFVFPYLTVLDFLLCVRVALPVVLLLQV